MFVGHLAVAFAAKRFRPDVSLGWYVAAATTLDLLWPIFLLLGIEQASIVPGATAFTPLVFDSYPWSHSLVMAIGWGVLLALIGRWRGVPKQALSLLVVLVVSHWVLDFITHAPDMPLWPGNSPKLGLGLWNSIPGTLVIESVMWLAALALYLKGRRASSWIGPVALWSLVLITTIMWAAGPWSPPPPGQRALGWFALIGWLLIPWTAIADRHYQER